jgi:hypothetical protein
MTDLPSLKVMGHRRLNARINVGQGPSADRGLQNSFAGLACNSLFAAADSDVPSSGALKFLFCASGVRMVVAQQIEYPLVGAVVSGV